MGIKQPREQAVGIDRNDAANPTQKAGEAVAHVQATAFGGWPKAIAVGLFRLVYSPSTGKGLVSG
jgi:hypothetical protein